MKDFSTVVYTSVSTERYALMSKVVAPGSKHGMMDRIRKDKANVVVVEHTSIWFKVACVVCVAACVYGMHMDSIDLIVGALK